MSNGGILISGGAGYIGSHVARLLTAQGERVVVIDNLSKGFKEAVLDADLVVGDIGDRELVSRVLQEYQVEAVMHFAAHTVVPESVSNPLKYYGNNTCNTRNLLECCEAHGVKHVVFSSTAAVYGLPDEGIASEETSTQPINAYGTSKLMSEWMLRDLSVATDLTYTALRYFNVAGCDPDGRIGQSTPGATLLIKVAVEVVTGKRDKMMIFGTDYDTPDGTGVRDYIHVDDLADAHIRALEYMRKGGESITLNCGYGHGYSVREVIQAVERANDHTPLKVEEAPRRAGDPPYLVAKAEKIREILGWEPKYDDLDFIVQSALNWERNSTWKHPSES